MQRRDYQLNDKLYSMLLPPVTQAMPLCSRSAVLIGAFAGLLADVKGLAEDKTTKTTQILERLASTLKQVDPVAANDLMVDAVRVSHLTCDGTSISSEIDFERHFSNYRGEVFQVMIWCLWESVRDFFPELEGIVQVAKEAAKDMSQSQKVG